MYIVMEHIFRIFHLANWNSILTKNLFPILLPLGTWQPPPYLLFLLFLTALDTADVGNYTAFILRWLTYFTYHIFEVHTCCRIRKGLLSCESWIIPTLHIYQSFYTFNCVNGYFSYFHTSYIWKMLQWARVCKYLFRILL